MSSDDVTITKPFLKWVGGKTQIIDTIINNYPTRMKNYHDVFLGGGSTLLALLSYVKAGKITVTKKIYAYDLNSDLINVYKNVQSKHDELYNKIKEIINDYNGCNGKTVNRKPKDIDEAKTSQESYYYWIRSNFNKLSPQEKSDIAGSAMFIFMNKTCFRGVYRTGKNGFNVPFGHYKTPKIIDEKELTNIHELIQNVKFKCRDFEKATSFVGYNAVGFDSDKHKKLFQMCNDLMKNKIKFMMSNSNVGLVTDAFPTKIYSVDVIECRRAIHSKNPAEKTNEVIIKSY